MRCIAEPAIDFCDDQSENSDDPMEVEDGDEDASQEEDGDDDYGDMAERDDDEFTKLLGQMRSRYVCPVMLCIQLGRMEGLWFSCSSPMTSYTA